MVSFSNLAMVGSSCSLLCSTFVVGRLVCGLVSGVVGFVAGFVAGFFAGFAAGFVAGFAAGFAAGFVAGSVTDLVADFVAGVVAAFIGSLIGDSIDDLFGSLVRHLFIGKMSRLAASSSVASLGLFDGNDSSSTSPIRLGTVLPKLQIIAIHCRACFILFEFKSKLAKTLTTFDTSSSKLGSIVGEWSQIV